MTPRLELGMWILITQTGKSLHLWNRVGNQSPTYRSNSAPLLKRSKQSFLYATSIAINTILKNKKDCWFHETTYNMFTGWKTSNPSWYETNFKINIRLGTLAGISDHSQGLHWAIKGRAKRKVIGWFKTSWPRRGNLSGSTCSPCPFPYFS